MKKFAIILLTIVFATSCSDNLESLNKNKKDPSNVSGESLFAAAQKRLTDQMLSPNVNLNNLRLWVQYWQETTYVDESNYDQVTRSIPDNHWDEMYRILKNLEKATEIIKKTDNPNTNAEKGNKLAIIEILNVYVYSNLVETFGNIPYTEALDINTTLPAYDDGAEVYSKLIDSLNVALNSIDLAEGSFDASIDLIYEGNVQKWLKFGNVLKLRMGVMLADVNQGKAQTIVNSVLTDGMLFAGIVDDATYSYSSAAPNNNPVNNELILSGRNDYVGAKTLISAMNDLKDPRRGYYFDPNINFPLGEVASVTPANSGATATITFVDPLDSIVVGNTVYIADESQTPPLVGTVTGSTSNTIDVEFVGELPSAGDQLICAIFKGGEIGEKSPYIEYSHPNRAMTVPTLPGTILSYSEQEFLLAEAIERNLISGDAEEHYKNAIRASFLKWGAPGVEDYLLQPEVDYTSALANSSSSPAWKEVIGAQAWIALYNRSFAPYLFVRRLDYPILTQPDRAVSGFPVRYTYPVNEQKLNNGNYSAAASDIGGDEPETQLFWDEFYTFPF